jgi:coproporphyrinogen III oxidase-like Fe-S oxidoreductase
MRRSTRRIMSFEPAASAVHGFGGTSTSVSPAASALHGFGDTSTSVSPAASAGPQAPPPGRGDPPRLLYLHVPFCEQLCPYCSFNRVRLDIPLARRYFRSLEREIRFYHERGYTFDSVYIGGGTPTLLPDELESALRLIRELWPVRQVSLETNPNHLTPPMLGRLRILGINRLSVGVQSFDDRILRAVGRYGKYGSGREIEERLAAAAGVFRTLNIDLIFNFPFQTEAMLAGDLEVVRRLGVDQITFYPLMAGRTARQALAQWGRISRGAERRFYRRIRRELAGTYQPASAWCFSRRNGGKRPAGGKGRDGSDAPLDEYIVEREEYAGLGCGSFGYIRGTIYANTFDIPRYIERLERGELPILMARRFPPREQVVYDCLLKLFAGRLDLAEMNRKHGREVLHEIRREVRLLRLIGAVRWSPRAPSGAEATLELTGRGGYFWVVFMREFFTAVNDLRERCMDLSRSPAVEDR